MSTNKDGSKSNVKSNVTLCTAFHTGAVLYEMIHQTCPYQNSNLK